MAVDAVFDSVSVVTTFKAELAKAGKAPEIRQKLEPDFVQIIVSSPESFQRHVIEDIARWRELGKEVEIKVE